jgi:transposase
VKGHPWEKAQIALAKSLLIDGYTVAQVARHMRVSWSGVARIANKLRAEGVPVTRARQGRRPKVAA